MLKVALAFVLVCVGALYARGWLRLGRIGHPPSRWRLALYGLGLAAIAAAVLSPIDDLADELFPVHMVQHLLLTMLAAPLVCWVILSRWCSGVFLAGSVASWRRP